MHSELPDFRRVSKTYAATFINSVLSGAGGASLLRLIEFEDHHFRAIFKVSYFQLAEAAGSPSKSQWNTLKKKMKRRNRSVFIYRQYGQIACDESERGESKPACLYLDFGFLYG